MPVEFLCSSCGAELRVADVTVPVVLCGNCRARVAVPTPAAEGEPTPPLAKTANPFPTSSPTSRQRRTPPPSATLNISPRLWALIAIVVVGLVAVGGFATWRLVAPPARWQTHESADGGFRVELPAAPANNVGEKLGVPTIPGGSVEGTTFRRAQYLVLWAEIQNRAWRTDEQIIDDSVQGSLAGGSAKRSSLSEPFTVGGFPARDLEMTTSNGETGVIRVIVADTRLYVVAVGGPSVDPQKPEVRRFLNSFEITDPKLAVGIPYAERVKRERDEQARKTAEEQARRATKRWEQIDAAFAAAAAGATPTRPVPSATVVPGLVSYLSFDHADPTLDEASGKSGGTLYGGAKIGPGARGKALHALLPGAGMDLTPLLPKLQLEARRAFTVAGWYRVSLDRAPPDGVQLNVQPVFTGENPAKSALKFAFWPGGFRGPGVDLRSALGTHGDPWRNTDTIAPQQFKGATTDSKWHHFAIVREHLNSRESITVYIDGQWYPPTVRLYLLTELTDLSRLFLGDASAAVPKGPNNPQARFAFLGGIDEFCVFDRALTGWEVRSLIGQETVNPDRIRPISPADLPGVTFHLPGLPGGYADASYESVSRKQADLGQGRENRLFSTPSMVESPVNEGVKLEGAARTFTKLGYALDVGGACKQFGVGADKPFTMVSWVLIPTTQKDQWGFVQADGVSYFGVNVGPGMVEVVLGDRESTKAKGVFFTAAEPEGAVRLKRTDAPQGEWYHLAITRSEGGEVRMLVNGEEGANPVRATFRGPTNKLVRMGLGLQSEKTDVSLCFDEFAMFDRLLTEAEILSLAGRKKNPKPKQ